MIVMFLCVFYEIIIPLLLLIYVLSAKLLLKPAMDLQKDQENPSSNDKIQPPIDTENNGINAMSSINDIDMDCGLFGEGTGNTDCTKVYIKPNVIGLTAEYDEAASNSKVYSIHEDIFVDNDPAEYDIVCDYEIHSNSEEGMWSYEENLPALEITTQLVHNGIIVNSTIFLTDDHWHTVSLVKDELYTCGVCQMYCDKEFVHDHVKMACHVANMENFKPLKMYDLNIIRKIKDLLHCGICNEQFHHTHYQKHEGTKKHEQYLLYAINKVSDIMYDLDVHSSLDPDRPFTFNTRPLGDNNQIFESFQSQRSSHNTTNSQTPDQGGRTPDQGSQTPDQGGQTSDQRSQTPDRISQSFQHKRQTVRTDSKSQTPDLICQTFNSKSQTPDRGSQTPDQGGQTPDQYVAQSFNNNSYKFNENKFKSINVYEDYSDDEEIDEYMTPYEGVSYASMARKPRIELPKYLKIDLGTKEVRVKFENWHMLITPEKKRFYCMVCGQSHIIRHKVKHVNDEVHLKKLSACTVLEAYDDYLIRRVNEMLYHCGHCNNLHYADQIINHIDAVHPKTNKIINTTKNTNNIYYDPIKAEPKQKDTLYRSVFKINSEFGEVTLCPFGSAVKVTVLSYNFIVKKGDGYYCELCECECDVRGHLRDLDHAERMVLTPFIQPFRNNLTRAVKGNLHCALCHMLVPLFEIYEHNLMQNHGNALAVALGIKKLTSGENTGPIVAKSTESVDNSSTNDNFTTALRNALKIAQEKLADFKNDSNTPVSKCSQSLSASINLKEEADDLGKNDLSESIEKSKQNAKIDETQYPPLPKPKPQQNPFEVLQKALSVGQKSVPVGQKLQPLEHQFAKQSEHNMNSPLSGQNLQALLQLPIGQYPQQGQNPLQHGQKQPLLSLPEPKSQPGQTLPQHGQRIPSLLDLNFGQKPQFGPNSFQHMQRPVQPGQNLLPGQSNLPMPQYTGPVLQYPQSTKNKTKGRPILVPNTNNYLHTTQFQEFLMKPPQVPIFNSSNQAPVFRFSGNVQNQDPKGSNAYNQNSVSNAQNHQNSVSNGQNQNSVSNGQNHQNSVLNIGDAKSDTEKKETDILQKNISVKNNTSVKNSAPVKNITVKANNLPVNLEQGSDEEKVFDELEIVLLTFKNTFYKISNLSYNALVYVDNGIRHCFVCSMTVKMDKFQYHIDSRDHIKNMKNHKFLDKYSGQLFRQMYLMYHCAICNVLMGSKEIKMHLDWPAHSECYQKSFSILNKKTRKELKSGAKVYAVETQKEAIFHNVNEPEMKIICAYEIIKGK